MNKSEKRIRENIGKGYRYPHDIESVASAIYNLEKKGGVTDKTLINDFIESINASQYSDIVNITYDYFKRLAQYEHSLIGEEKEKILKLYESINILLYLGAEGGDSVPDDLETIIIGMLARRKLVLPPVTESSSPWWKVLLVKSCQS